MNKQQIGDKISQLRKNKGWTQIKLAERLSVSDKAISRWETGTGYPEMWQLPEIAKLFNVTTDYLLGIGESEPEVKRLKNQVEVTPNNEDNLSKNKQSIKKDINITLLIVSVLMLASYFFKLMVFKVSLFGAQEISASFSVIKMFEMKGLNVLIATLLLLASLYEIINNTLLLSLSRESDTKYLLASKIGSLISSFMLVFASIIFVIEHTYVYPVILLVFSLLMLMLSFFNLQKKSVIRVKEKNKLINKIANAVGLIAVVMLIIDIAKNMDMQGLSAVEIVILLFILLLIFFYSFSLFSKNTSKTFNILSFIGRVAGLIISLALLAELIRYKVDFVLIAAVALAVVNITLIINQFLANKKKK